MNKRFHLQFPVESKIHQLQIDAPMTDILEALQNMPGGLRINFSKSNGIYICLKSGPLPEKSKKIRTISDAFDVFIKNAICYRRYNKELLEYLKPLAYNHLVLNAAYTV